MKVDFALSKPLQNQTCLCIYNTGKTPIISLEHAFNPLMPYA